MKILYSIQATGNGHISRAIDVLPYLRKYGEVDVFLSGANSGLSMPGGTMYKSKGISMFYDKTGGLDYRKTLWNFKPFRAIKEAKALPVTKYDAVINDFEPITSMACAIQHQYCVGFGHQASFQFPTVPMADKFAPIGKTILKRYAPCDEYVGLHYRNYDWNNVFNPILSDKIVEYGQRARLNATTNKIVIYLPSYSNAQIHATFVHYTGFKFIVFAKEDVNFNAEPTFEFVKPNKPRFVEELANCHMVITSAGFETPAEALYLGKRLVVIPIKGQYEQACNAEALRKFGVPIFDNLQQVGHDFRTLLFRQRPDGIVMTYSTAEIIDKLMLKFLH